MAKRILAGYSLIRSYLGVIFILIGCVLLLPLLTLIGYPEEIEFAKYFMESEQTPSAVAVGVLVNNQGEVPFAGGYIVQLMPNVEDAIVDMIEGRVANMKPVTSLLKEGFSLEEIVKAVTGDEEIKILEYAFLTSSKDTLSI